MDLTLSWLASVWNAFSLWTSTQPTFVQVAIGMGLFYLVWYFLRMMYRLVHFTLTGLFAGAGRGRVKRDIKPPSGQNLCCSPSKNYRFRRIASGNFCRFQPISVIRLKGRLQCFQ